MSLSDARLAEIKAFFGKYMLERKSGKSLSALATADAEFIIHGPHYMENLLAAYEEKAAEVESLKYYKAQYINLCKGINKALAGEVD